MARGDALDAAAKAIGASGGGRVHAIQGDVAVPADVQRSYDEAMQAFGKIDIVVNNAGTSRTGAFEEITDEVGARIDQKLFAAIRLTRLAWPQMKAALGARHQHAQYRRQGAARAQRADLDHPRRGLALTKALAGEGALQRAGQRRCWSASSSRPARAGGEEAGDPARRLHGRAPRSPARPHRAGGGVRQHRLLPRPDAGSYITGTAINVDGGRSPVV